MNKKNVAILTNFLEFQPGYSLTGIVIDQAYMLLREGHKVVIYVSENFNSKYDQSNGIEDLKKRFPSSFKILKKTKFMHLKDYQKDELNSNHKLEAKSAGKIFYDSFIEEGINAIFTHDFIFTGWNLPFFHAIIDTNNLMRRNKMASVWFHWIHSIPSGGRDWWSLEKLGLNHHIVFPNKTEIMRVAESYQVPANRVTIMPHIKDIRNWYDFSDDTREFLDQFPNIMQSEVIQVYPVSTDRLSAKQLGIVMQIFGEFKTKGKIPVCLIIANQWATGKQPKENIKEYIEYGKSYGLEYEKDFIFTSEVKEEYALGISKRMIRELQLLSNVFIFPTREESFGLVGPEAAFSGALPVVNRSLLMMQEVMSTHAPAFEFGSFQIETPVIKEENYITAVAMAILNRIYSNEAILTKTYCRMKYNMDNIYAKYYVQNLG